MAIEEAPEENKMNVGDENRQMTVEEVPPQNVLVAGRPDEAQ